MSFKSSLEALFKLSGGQAMPGTDIIEQEVVTGSWATVTAPFDGYFCIQTTGDEGAVKLLEVQSFTSRLYTKCTTDTIYGRYTACFIPCRKGAGIQYCITGGPQFPTVYAYFIKTVGSS